MAEIKGYSGGDLFTRFAHGVLQGYLMRRDREFRDQQVDEQRQYENQYRQDNRDFLRQQQQDAYTHEGEIHARDRGEATSDADKKFRENLLLAGINAAQYQDQPLSPEDLADLRSLAPDLDEKSFAALMKQVEGARLHNKKATGGGSGGGGEKETKPLDYSTVAGDIKAFLGFEPAAEFNQAVFKRMQRDGIPLEYALAAEAPDPSKVPRAGGRNEVSILKEMQATRADQLKAAAALGVDPLAIVAYVQDNESKTGKPDYSSAFRHARTDQFVNTIGAQIAAQLGGTPDDIEVPMKEANAIIVRNPKFTPIEGADTRSLKDFVDEALNKNMAEGDIQKILTELVSGPAPKQAPGSGISGFPKAMMGGELGARARSKVFGPVANEMTTNAKGVYGLGKIAQREARRFMYPSEDK